MLGQRVHAALVEVGVREQLDLGDHLIGEAVRHHEARVTRRAPEVQQATLGEHDDRVTVGEHPLVDLRLHLATLDALELRQAGHVDLGVEVTDVADDGVVLHLRHRVDADHVLAPVVVTKMSAVPTTSSSVVTW